VIFTNAAADRLLKRCPDLAVRRNRLHAKFHADTTELEHLTRRATGANGRRPTGGAVAIHRADGGLPLQVIVAPVSADNRTMLSGSAPAVALLVIHDPNVQASIPQEIVAKLFGLTPMEVSLLVALSERRTLRQYSDDHRVTYHTARTHLRNVFAKTNTSKQSDLVRLMSGVTHSVAIGARLG
jgi:DNA-binding CsgD family transcriptional regulator